MLKQFARWSVVLVLLIGAAWAVAAPAALPRAGQPPHIGPAMRTSDWAQFKGKRIDVLLATKGTFNGSVVEVVSLDGDTYLNLHVENLGNAGRKLLINTRQIVFVEALP